MAKLNQMLAVRKGLRARTEAAVTTIYHQFQKPALYAGLTRTYQPRDEEGERLPAERQLVQRSVTNDLHATANALAPLFDVVATVDAGNMTAVADVVVGNQPIVTGAPVPFLLFLEKQLIDLRTQIGKAPTLDPETLWEVDGRNGGHRAAEVVTTRARKVPRVLMKAPATERHPAQTEVYMADEIVGDWTLTRFSGAISAERKRTLLARVDALLDATRKAVEAANDIEVEQKTVGRDVFAFLLAE